MSFIKTITKKNKYTYYELWDKGKFVRHIGNAKKLKVFQKEKTTLAHVGQSTGNNEWYTPPAFLAAARKVMGSIDVDPASSELANKAVGATTFYTTKDDGRRKSWAGTVWMNPPYSQPLVSDFCELLVKKYWNKEVTQACVLINNATETSFYQRLASCCSAVCLIKGRVKFLDEEGNEGAPLQGQTILYFGENYIRFAQIFAQFGVVLYADKQG